VVAKSASSRANAITAVSRSASVITTSTGAPTTTRSPPRRDHARRGRAGGVPVTADTTDRGDRRPAAWARRWARAAARPGARVRAGWTITGVAIPKSDLARIEAYCADRVPEWAREQVQVTHTVRAGTVTVIETRPPWNGVGEWTRRPIGQLRHDPSGWTLWWPDRRGRWHPDDTPAAATVDPLLAVLDDPAKPPFW
jgi:hypothetical protein